MKLTRKMIGSLTSLQRIYEFRVTHPIKTLGYFILLNLIMLIPLNFGLLFSDTFDYQLLGINMEQSPPDWFYEQLPDDCGIIGNQLTCDHTYTYENKTDGITESLVIINPSQDYVIQQKGFYFYKDYFVVYANQSMKLTFNYDGIDRTINKRLLDNYSREDAAKLVLDQLFQCVKDQFLIVVILLITGLFMLMNYILILGFSILSMLFKFGDSNFPSLKEVWTIYVFSSTIPTFIALVFSLFGLFTFVPLIYNFGTPIVAYLVYRKYIKNSLLTHK